MFTRYLLDTYVCALSGLRPVAFGHWVYKYPSGSHFYACIHDYIPIPYCYSLFLHMIGPGGSESDSGGSSAGAIAGGVIGGIVVVIIIVIIIIVIYYFFVYKKKGKIHQHYFFNVILYITT